MSFEWTPEAVETLHALSAEGMTASLIAIAIGAPSRNAVLGKLFRIRHPLRISKRVEPRKPVPRAPMAAKTAGLTRRPTGPMSFLDAEDGRCRWPLWGDARHAPIEMLFYCGSPTGGAPYCPNHADRCNGIGSRGERDAHRVKVAA